MLVQKIILLKYLDALKGIEELHLSDNVSDENVKQSNLIVDTFSVIVDRISVDSASDMIEFDEDFFTNHINSSNKMLSKMKALNSELKQFIVGAGIYDMIHNTEVLTDSSIAAKELAKTQDNVISIIENRIKLTKIMKSLCG